MEYHLSALGFCPCLSQCCLAQVCLCLIELKVAAHLPLHSSPLGRLCCLVLEQACVLQNFLPWAAPHFLEQPNPCPLSRAAVSRKELGTAQHICLPVTLHSIKPGPSCGFGNAPVLSGVSLFLCRVLGCSRVEKVGGQTGVPRAALGGGQHLL